MNKKVGIYDLAWYLLGLMFFGFTALIYNVIVTRVLGIEAAGKFSFAYAVACTFFAVGVYFGKSFQITDKSNRYSDSDYLYNRLTTCLFMLVMTLIFCVFKGYDLEKLLLILLLTIYRGLDAFVASIHAIVQKKDRSYKVGMSYFFRTLLLIILFIFILLIFKNLIVSAAVLSLINLLFVLIVDFKIVKKHIKKSKYSNMKNLILLIEGFSVFIFSFLAIYVTNASKYAIDSLANDSMQGLFSIIIMPASFVALVSLYIVQPFLNNISNLIENKKLKELHLLVIKLVSGVVIVGVITIVITYFIGVPVLNYLYGVNIDSQRFNLVLILIGSILYSIYSLFSQVLIAMRKNFFQVFTLFLTFVISIVMSRYLVNLYGIDGASYSYIIVMAILMILTIFGYIYYSLKLKKNCNNVTIRLMGGLGNQMFEYAALRNKMLEEKISGTIDLVGITNKTHNVYGLDHLSISKNVKIVNNSKSIKGFISYLLYGFYWVFLDKKKNGIKFMTMIEPYLNSIGIYLVVDGYIKIDNIKVNNNYMIGYFQSKEYFNKNIDIIRKELQVNEKLEGNNKKVYNELTNNNSVCIHIRRGDYVGSFFEVCTKDYYLKAVKEMNKKVKNAKYYVFSDDIDWVKNNIDLKNATYIDWKNNQYQDLKLMSGCKNFIMSNSSFSYFAQFLSLNDKKVVIAPNVWFKNGKKIDIYEDNWILVDAEGK